MTVLLVARRSCVSRGAVELGCALCMGWPPSRPHEPPVVVVVMQSALQELLLGGVVVLGPLRSGIPRELRSERHRPSHGLDVESMAIAAGRGTPPRARFSLWIVQEQVVQSTGRALLSRPGHVRMGGEMVTPVLSRFAGGLSRPLHFSMYIPHRAAMRSMTGWSGGRPRARRPGSAENISKDGHRDVATAATHDELYARI